MSYVPQTNLIVIPLSNLEEYPQVLAEIVVELLGKNTTEKVEISSDTTTRNIIVFAKKKQL